MSDKYELIDAQCADRQTTAVVVDAPTITQMCVWLEVSRSGFYEWRDRPISATGLRHEELKAKIKQLFELSEGTYGYRRIHVELLRAGIDVGEEQVRVLMRELGLVACQPRPYRTTTVAGGDSAAPDLVRRVFAADAPGVKLVGDITYIHTWEGWLYLATVIDCFNREVVGYAMADHMRAGLVVDALDMAARTMISRKVTFFIPTGAHSTRQPSSRKRSPDMGRGSRLGGLGVVMIMRWRSRSMVRSRSSVCTALSIPRGKPRWRMLRGTSKSFIIIDEFIQGLVTGPRTKSATST